MTIIDFVRAIDAMTVVNTKDMPRADWLEWRKKGIGGSETAAIMGKSPFESALSVYISKTDLAEPVEMNDAMHFGNLLEPIVADEFTRRSGFQAYELHKMIRHPIYEFMLANVDRVIYDEVMGWGILECKTANQFKQMDWEGSRTPEHYYYQVQHYLAVTGLQFAYIACLIGGQTFRYNYIERDEAVIEQIFEGVTDFWFNHVLPEVMPDVSHLDADNLGRLYPKHTDSEWVSLAENETWLWDDLLAAKKQSAAAVQAEDLAANRIKNRMKTAELLYMGGEKIVSWKANVKGVRSFKPNLPKKEELA